jgi:hypothetical protein
MVDPSDATENGRSFISDHTDIPIWDLLTLDQ